MKKIPMVHVVNIIILLLSFLLYQTTSTLFGAIFKFFMGHSTNNENTIIFLFIDFYKKKNEIIIENRKYIGEAKRTGQRALTFCFNLIIFSD